MRELFDTTLNETDTPFSKKQLIEAAQNAEVLVPTAVSYTHLTLPTTR